MRLYLDWRGAPAPLRWIVAVPLFVAMAFVGCGDERTKKNGSNDDDGGSSETSGNGPSGSGGAATQSGNGSGAAASSGAGAGEPTCQEGGTECESFDDCCSGVCANQVCTSCAGDGEGCESEGCCLGLSCYSGTWECGSCKLDFDTCSLASDCCSNICDQGSCAPCHTSGTSCGLDQECCSGNCLDGFCSECKDDGATCTFAEDCCSGFCDEGICGAPSGTGGSGGGTAGSCCSTQTTAGCDDFNVMLCVCGVDPFCCNTAWNATCVNEVESLGCGSCL